MKVVIINKSDRTGGAAIVSYRLLKSLRQIGVDARMLVVEKLSDNYYVDSIASPYKSFKKFIKERLKIYFANGFNREDLFKIDIASDGLPIYKHEWVKEADVVCLNWINQGMLSLEQIKKIAKMGKPIVWTMHDMWNLTGICHHAGSCRSFEEQCGNCRYLGSRKSDNDISHKTWIRKNKLYNDIDITFVAVSNWLADKCKASSLIKNQRLMVIPNAFPISKAPEKLKKPGKKGVHNIVMGASRLDDHIKGLPILVEATKIIAKQHPELLNRLKLITYGDIRNPEKFPGIALKHEHLGVVGHEKDVNDIYKESSIVVSTSHYETLPGTLIEGQAYGCIPVSFNQGGQSDIIEHLETGYLAEYSKDLSVAAQNIADGIIWAMGKADEIDTSLSENDNLLVRLHENVYSKFSGVEVARAYERLFNSLVEE